MSRWLAVRTVLDRLAAAALGAVSAPVLAVCAWLVHRHDGGPPLITVDRVGTGGRTFGMWKLRSMRADGPDGRATGRTLSGTSDDRITPVGARLRAYYLDELPQLWNVVRGEMSLLGPRPEAPDWVHLDDPQWREVLEVPPGMAGPTQVIVGDWERELISADDDGTAYVQKVLPVKLAIDAWYVRSASPATDALVAVTLLRRLLPGTESWTLKKRVFAEVPEARVVQAWLNEHWVVTPGTASPATTVDASVEPSPAPSQAVRTMQCE